MTGPKQCQSGAVMQKGEAMDDTIHNVDRVYSTGKLTHDDCMDAARYAVGKLPSAYDNICEMPSAQQWVPCKERLPEKDGEYLTTTEDGLCDVESYGDGEWFYDDVVAWAPLPEPWKGNADAD